MGDFFMLQENYKNIVIIFNNSYHMHMPFQSAHDH